MKALFSVPDATLQERGAQELHFFFQSIATVSQKSISLTLR